MKTFTFPELKKIAVKQGYKLASLENDQGERLQFNNTLKTKIDTHLRTLEERLKSDLYPNGVYYICFAQSINKARNPDKYPIVKGKITKELSEQLTVRETNKPQIITTVHTDVLTYEQALKMQQTISDLRADVKSLQLENEYLKQEIADMENEEPELQEGNKTVSNIKSFLDESLPSIMSVADKFFANQDRKLALEEKKLDMKKTVVHTAKRTLIEPGSQEHLALIRSLNTSKDPTSGERLNKELDKLEVANHAMYLKLCEELGITEEEEEEEEDK